jgi:HEAT repeat protein
VEEILFEDDEFVRRHVLQFIDCYRQFYPDYDRRAQCIQAMRRLGVRRVSFILQELLDGDDEELWGWAAEVAVRVDSKEGTTLLLPFLEDENWGKRWFAGDQLYFGDSTAVPYLIKTLKNDPDVEVRCAAASSLGGIGDVGALVALAEVEKADHEYNELGHSPGSLSTDAISEILERQVVEYVTTSPNTWIEHHFSFGGTLRGEVIHTQLLNKAANRIQERYVEYKNLPSNALVVTAAHYTFKCFHPSPFIVKITFDENDAIIRRDFIFTLSARGWSITTIAKPES